MRSVSADNVGVTFVNMLLGRGILNGVINLTLGVLNFTPDTEAETGIDMDSVISSRLRMDIPCAKQLHKALGDLLDSVDQKESDTPIMPPSTNAGVASGKPN